jgi:hypothetical protein
VRASAQKWVGGAWQEIASTATVDRNGRMSFKIDKSMVTAQDILRVVVSDTGDSADHRDEIIGNQTLGATPLIAVIGGLDADQQVTANPLTTLSALLALDSGAAGASANIVQLLSSIVDSRTTAEVNTPAKIAALATLASKVGMAVQGDNSKPLTVDDFAALKISGVNAGNLSKVQAQLAKQADDGSTVNTWAKLADAVFTVTNVPAINTVAGDDIINLAERTAGVTLTGTAGKDDTVTLFYPDGSVIKSGIVTRDSGTGTSVWNWSYTLTAADWLALGANGANGVDKVIGIQSHNTVKGIDSIKVMHTVTIDTVVPVFGAPIALSRDTGTAGDGITSDGKVLVSGLEAGASWAYKIDTAPTMAVTGPMAAAATSSSRGLSMATAIPTAASRCRCANSTRPAMSVLAAMSSRSRSIPPCRPSWGWRWPPIPVPPATRSPAMALSTSPGWKAARPGNTVPTMAATGAVAPAPASSSLVMASRRSWCGRPMWPAIAASRAIPLSSRSIPRPLRRPSS